VHSLMGEGVVSVVSVGGHTLHDMKDYTHKCKKDKNGQVRRTSHKHISTQGKSHADDSVVCVVVRCVCLCRISASSRSSSPCHPYHR
jgi:hypothetical protein